MSEQTRRAIFVQSQLEVAEQAISSAILGLQEAYVSEELLEALVTVSQHAGATGWIQKFTAAELPREPLTEKLDNQAVRVRACQRLIQPRSGR